MEYAQYFVFPADQLDRLEGIVPAEQLQAGEADRWALAITYSEAVPQTVTVAIDFNNHEWSAWQFSIYDGGEVVLEGLFGENGESGVDLEDNKLEGDLDAAAAALGVDAKRLKKIFRADFPDIEKFAKLVGFPIIPVTPMDFDED